MLLPSPKGRRLPPWSQRSNSLGVLGIAGDVGWCKPNRPVLVEAREIVAAFQWMIRKKSAEEFEPWLQRAKANLVASFANGIAKDRDAFIPAITLPWSNGQTEEQMYGRGKLDILQARVIDTG